MEKPTAVVIDLAARRGKLPGALREQPTTTREQLLADTTDYLLNRAIDLQQLGEAEGMTPAEIRQELITLTMHSGIFGQAAEQAVTLAFGVMDAPETA